MAHRLGLATVMSLVLWASCSLPRPDVGLTISGTTVPSSREGSCHDGGCGGGACPAPVAPLTIVRTTTPVRFDFVVGSEVNQIHGAIWQGETMAAKAIEQFTLVDGARSYMTTELKPGGRYYMIVLIYWSRLLDRGDSSRAFLIEIASP
jgi:hypothetical protein